MICLVSTGYGQAENRPAELQQSCDGGNAQDCKRLGDMYRRSHLPDAETKSAALYQKALPFFQKACDEGDAIRCGDLGDVYADGLGVPSDMPKAVQLWKKACDASDAAGCYALGNMYKGSWGALYPSVPGLPQDNAKAVALYQKALPLFLKACSGGDAKSCGNLGLMYDEGHGVPKDFAKVAQFWKKACDGGDSGMCIMLGDWYYFGASGTPTPSGAPNIIIPKDTAKAIALYQKACDDWYWVGCVKVKMYAK